MTSKRKLKPISFSLNSENDIKLLEYVEKFDSFGSYVKDLILKDMETANSNNEIANAINRLSDIFMKNNFTIEKKEDITFKENNDIDEEQKNIIKGFLNT